MLLCVSQMLGQKAISQEQGGKERGWKAVGGQGRLKEVEGVKNESNEKKFNGRESSYEFKKK